MKRLVKLLVLAGLALMFTGGTAQAAPRYCGTVPGIGPDDEYGSVQWPVAVLYGSVPCDRALALITGFIRDGRQPQDGWFCQGAHGPELEVGKMAKCFYPARGRSTEYVQSYAHSVYLRPARRCTARRPRGRGRFREPQVRGIQAYGTTCARAKTIIYGRILPPRALFEDDPVFGCFRDLECDITVGRKTYHCGVRIHDPPRGPLTGPQYWYWTCSGLPDFPETVRWWYSTRNA
jgi:hypothetical protein